MNIWIISDCERIVASISESLQRHDLDCPPANILRIREIGQDQLSPITGIVFVSVPDSEGEEYETVRELRRIIGSEAILVVVSSSTNDSNAMKAIRAGANDFLKADSSFDDDFADFISRVRQDFKLRQASGKAVIIIPCQAPSDANLLAVNLAAAIATVRGSCGLLDFHFRGGDLATLLHMTPRHTLLDLISQSGPIDEAMFRQAFTNHRSGIALLASPISYADVKEIEFQACRELVSLALSCWPVVFVNSEDIQSAAKVISLNEVDEIILTMRLDVASLLRTKQQLECLANAQHSNPKIHVVAMGTGHFGELSLADVTKALQVSKVHSIPDDAPAVIMSVNVGNPLIFELPRSKPAIAINRFARSELTSMTSSSENTKSSSSNAMKAAAMFALNTLPFCK